jgi:triphosphoribosyl-dephospho-CoA synthase
VRGTAANAELALLLEVTSTPKPGNVDREREYPGLRFEHFVAGAVGTRDGFEIAADGGPVGHAIERAVEGMSHQRGGNTQFGAVLLVAPLVRAAAGGSLDPETANKVVADTTVEDAVNFYRAFDHVDVAVDDPPQEMDELDVRRGGAAEPAIREQDLSLEDIMEASADIDGLAAEWTTGFPRTFDTAERLQTADGSVTDAAATVFLELLADEIDTFVVTQHDRETAREVRERARGVLAGEEPVREFATECIEREINPGTTADIIAGGLFVALERGVEI